MVWRFLSGVTAAHVWTARGAQRLWPDPDLRREPPADAGGLDQ